MKFSVGYQLREAGVLPFYKIAEQYRKAIEEVYFPWPALASGRDPLPEGAEETLIRELQEIQKLGIRLNLLLNGNCYGSEAMSEKLAETIAGIFDRLGDESCKPQVVTTASPAIAFMVKRISPQTELRASVNMRIGSVKGMEYTGHLFDSFYVCRDHNRDLERVRELKQWADENGKKLYLQANSGCLRNCSFQTFHDNLVSHHDEVEGNRNISGFLPYACWNHLKNPKNWVSVLQNTWIRPEDVHRYEPYVSMMKLATRMHRLPMMVIDAYAKESYGGNLLDLLEPGVGPAFAPYILDNRRFPEDWFERTTQCDKKCKICGYCRGVLERILVEN